MVLDEFIETLKSKSAKKSYRLSLEKLFRHFADQNILDLDDNSIIYYLKNLKTRSGESVKESTYNSTLNAIKSFYAWLSKTKGTELKIKKLKNRKAKKVIKKHEAISKQNFDEIIDNTEEMREKLFYTIMFEAGLRVSEALALTIGDIDSERIRIGGENAREIPSSKNILNLLDKYLNDERLYITEFYALRNLNLDLRTLPLFVSTLTRSRISYYTVNGKFKELTKSFKNEDGSSLSLSQLRYAFIFDKLNDIEDKLVSELVGSRTGVHRTYKMVVSS